MRKRKLAFIGFFSLVVIMVLSTSPVFAYTNTDFAGSTLGNIWLKMTLRSTKRDSDRLFPIVNWKDSDQENHRQWFSLVPHGRIYGVGETLARGFGKTAIERHRAQKDGRYYLVSKREHHLDPMTYIIGRWSPN